MSNQTSSTAAPATERAQVYVRRLTISRKEYLVKIGPWIVAECGANREAALREASRLNAKIAARLGS